MTSTWIVGMDGSDNARHAAKWAVDQAVGRDVRVVILASWTIPIVPVGGMPSAVIVEDWAELESQLLHSAEALAAEISLDGVEVEARVVQGPAPHVLIEASREADLLVVGARGLGRLKGLMLGSVSQRCVAHSVVPVAVIPMEAPLGPVRQIVVGYDASANARAAAQWALKFAETEATVTILDALALAPWLAEDLVRERFPVEVDAAEADFHAQMGEIDPTNRAAHSFVVADVRVALLDASSRSDLLVLGARGRGKLSAMLLGSTTTWMLHGATAATVVVPSPERSGD